MAKRIFKTPVVVKILRSGDLGDVQRLQRKAFGTRRIRTFRQQIDAFVTISQEIDRELESIGIPATQRQFIPNGIDISRFKPVDPQERRERRSQLGFADSPTAVFTGRLSAEKRVNLLVAIWPAVRDTVPDAQLLILGTGPLEAELKRAAGPGVYFTGVIDDVVPYLQAADVFVLPSIAEGLSGALLEAMATGLPTIATAVGGAPDVIEHGVNGWLIRPDDHSDLRDSLIHGLSNHLTHSTIGHHARDRITHEYALPATATKLRALYDELLASREPVVRRTSRTSVTQQ
jgi:glycosyltransferase involved in cell wall biosynthesis